MSRSLKKGPYVDEKLLRKIKAFSKTSTIKTYSRDSTIIPEMVGITLAVHNGKDFVTIKISEDMVGHRLGEFAPTTKFIRHGGKLQREVEKKEKSKEL